MNYFEIKIQPPSDGSSAEILIDNFHPRWQEAAAKLLDGQIIEVMEHYTQRINVWSKAQIDLEFNEYGLNHIKLPHRGGLDLDARLKQYSSHNVDCMQDAGPVVAVAIYHINCLNLVIRTLPDE